MTDPSRKEIARTLLGRGIEPIDLALEILPEELPAEASLTADLGLQFPAGTAPIPRPLPDTPDPEDPLPRADVLIITWTVAEQNGLADVMTPGFSRNRWYRYRRYFDDRYLTQIRDGAPARRSRRLGSWFPCRVGDHRVICFKSELHLNQDGIRTGEGTATLPVKDLFLQIIDEVRPRLIITTGTSGATYLEHDLGDVVVTRGAKFRLSDEFRNEVFRDANYRSDWVVPRTHFTAARNLMQGFQDRLVEPAFAPPTKRFAFDGPPVSSQPPNRPDIKLDGDNMPAFHPILTTDFFEFGTSSNGLEKEGCAVEMGDAVLGLACEELDEPPLWVVARNISDPQINADLPVGDEGVPNMQTHWAVWYYEEYGYWTSVNGALASWAIAAGFQG